MANTPPQTVAEFLSSGIVPVQISSLADSDRTCTICYVDYGQVHDESNVSEQSVQIETCGHVFGRSCLETHVNGGYDYSNKCPKCRTILYGRDTDQPDEQATRLIQMFAELSRLGLAITSSTARLVDAANQATHVQESLRGILLECLDAEEALHRGEPGSYERLRVLMAEAGRTNLEVTRLMQTQTDEQAELEILETELASLRARIEA